VSLTDPELDLLLEMLADDPADEAYLQVGEELVRRTRWHDALRVLAQGVILQDGVSRQTRALELLARVHLELGRYDDTLAQLAKLKVDPTAFPERARLEILALERSGRTEQARDRALRFLQVDGRDVVVRAVLERLAAPPPSPKSRSRDPFYTVERAERYVELGRADRAVRVYRKILMANLANPSIEHRMRQLMTTASEVDDDLSAELTDPGLVPESPEAILPTELAMPAPALATPLPPERTSSEREGTARYSVSHAPNELKLPSPGDPPLAVRFADMEDEGPTLRVDVAALLKRYAESSYEEEDTIVDLSIVASELGERAGVIGAALLARNEGNAT